MNPHPTPLAASGRQDPPPDRVSPYRTLWQAMVWLFSIAAPAGWILLLVSFVFASSQSPNDPLEAAPWLAALFPVMVCLVTIWALLAHQRLPAALARGTAQLGSLYFSALVVLLLDSRLRPMPWAAAIGLALFVVPPLVVSLVLRLCRWRLVRGRRDDQELALLPRGYQFRLVDLFAWTTLVAVFLGLGMLLLSQFDKEPSGWDGLGPAIMVFISAMLCVPTGALAVVFTWLVLAEKHRRARGIVAACLAIAWLGLLLCILTQYRSDPSLPNDDAYFALAAPPALAVPTLLLLGLARLLGWRMVRLPRRAMRG